MIAILSFAAILGVFFAGHFFEMHTVMSFVLLGASCIGLGVLTGILERRSQRGLRIAALKAGMSWGELWMAAARIGINRNEMVGEENVYIRNGTALQPVRSIFAARINGERSFIFESEETDGKK